MEVASGILNFAGTKLASKIFEEIGSTLGVKKGLDELQEIVEGIKSVLQDFGHKVIKNDPSLKWLKILKDIAYDIDDLLNEFYMEAEKHKAEIDSDKHVMVKCFCEKPNSILFRYKMANKIKTIKERYQASVDKRRDIKTLKTSSPIEPSQDRQLATGELSSLPIIDEKTTFGRDYDKSKIIDMLIKTSDREPVQKISIVGIGGSGKTTLSKLVFNDKNQIEKHFEVRIWVYVSQDFDVEKLIWKLYEAMPNKKNGHENFQSVSKKILETLSSKRFLLVLDDVWEKDPHKWNDFKLFLKDGAAGSRILLTTRSKEVAEIVKSIPYDLMGLSEDYGWELFQQSSGRVEEDFVEIGKELVKKCSGVPLALKALGWIVGRKKTVSSWQAVRDSELWNVDDVEDRVFRSLLLSYAHLPSYLQQCFVYCSIFPKGYIIQKHHLIGEWIGCGFITLINEVEHPEEVGNEYFDSLLKMSFLQDLVEYEYDGIGTCKMHDLVHDLTRYILKDEIVSEPNNITNDSAPRCRYLSLTESTNKIDRRLINKVRALYVANGNFIFDKPIKKATCVRSVTLEHIDTITSLSPFILKTEYLGYLRISNLNFEALPDAISFVGTCKRFMLLIAEDF